MFWGVFKSAFKAESSDMQTSKEGRHGFERAYDARSRSAPRVSFRSWAMSLLVANRIRYVCMGGCFSTRKNSRMQMRGTEPRHSETGTVKHLSSYRYQWTGAGCQGKMAGAEMHGYPVLPQEEPVILVPATVHRSLGVVNNW